MKSSLTVPFPSVLALCVLLLLPSCLMHRDRLEAEGILRIHQPTTFVLGGLQAVHVDPRGSDVTIAWKGYNVRTGDAFHTPFERVRISSDTETYTLSTEAASPHTLLVNNAPLDWDRMKERLVIAVGEGISIEPRAGQGALPRLEELDDTH